MIRLVVAAVFLLASLAMLAPVVAEAASPPSSAGELPTTEAVLERFVAAVGGRAALERIEVRHYRGTIEQDLSWKEPQHEERPFVAEADAGGRVRYAEALAWDDLPEENGVEPQRKLRWVMHPRFALVVEQFFPGLKVTGRETREGRRVILLTPASLPEEHYTLYFDEETGLLNHVGYHNDLRGWHEVDGVLFPQRWVFGRKGGHTTYVFEEVASGPAPNP